MGKRQFEAVFSSGKRVSGKLARLIALPGTGKTGFATSRKIGAHPQRNRLKRRFREALRLQSHLIEENLDYVLVLNPKGLEASFDVISAEVATLFKEMRERWAAESESS